MTGMKNRFALRTLVAVVLAVETLAGTLSAAPVSADRPGTPYNVVATAVAPKEILLTWTDTASEPHWIEAEVTRNGQPWAFAGFGPYRTAIDCRGGSIRHILSTSILNCGVQLERYTFTDLSPDTDYCFRLRARDLTDTVSEFFSAWACAHTPACVICSVGRNDREPPPISSVGRPIPAEPTQVLAEQVDDHAVLLTWFMVNAGNTDHFEVLRDGDLLAEVPLVLVIPGLPPLVQMYSDTADQFNPDPAPGGTYSYVVCAVSPTDRRCADPVSVTLQ
jgi:hypothetical protein